MRSGKHTAILTSWDASLELFFYVQASLYILVSERPHSAGVPSTPRLVTNGRAPCPCLLSDTHVSSSVKTCSQANVQCGCTLVGTGLYTSPSLPDAGTRRHSQRQFTVFRLKACTRLLPAASAAPTTRGWPQGGLERASPSCYSLPLFYRVLTPPATCHHAAPVPQSPFLSGLLSAGARDLNRVDGWAEGTVTFIFAAIPTMHVYYINKINAQHSWYRAHFLIYADLQIVASPRIEASRQPYVTSSSRLSSILIVNAVGEASKSRRASLTISDDAFLALKHSKQHDQCCCRNL